MALIRGGSYRITVTVVNKATGNPIDLTPALGILVGLYGDGRRVIGKWSLIDKSAEGFGPILDYTAAGVVEVVLNRTESLTALEKTARLEVVVVLPDPDFVDGAQYSIATDITLDQVERSIFEGTSAL